MIHYVTVGVAMSRPPKIDEYRRYCVVAANQHEAELIAQQMAATTSVMPVESRWESSHRAGPVQPFGALGCMCWCVEWSDDIGDGIDGWQIHGRCPYHSEEFRALMEWDKDAPDINAATEPAECPPGVHSMFDFCPGRAICEDGWEEPVDHGIRSAECEAGTCDCDGAVPQADEWGDDFIPPTVDRLMEVQGVMGSIAGDPPTPETANGGGPDTDDTTATTSLPYVGVRKVTLKVCPCGDIGHAPDTCPPAPEPVLHCRCGCPWPCKYFLAGQGYPMHRIVGTSPYATGAIVPDELKRKLVCGLVCSEGHTYDRRCALQPLDVPHVCETSRCWQECRNRIDAAKPSTGVLNCTVCNNWNHGLGYTKEDATKAFLALHSHRNICTETGRTECSSLSQQRRPTWLDRVRCWLHRDLHH